MFSINTQEGARQRTTVLVAVVLLVLSAVNVSAMETVLVEAENFDNSGRWVLDTQVMDQMGSPYLLAHGLGQPVADATTTVEFPQNGEYRIWVRTRDWVGQWKKTDLSPAMKAAGTPGKFQLLVDGQAVATTFGTEGAEWHWQDGGVINIQKKNITLALRDLTGFDGRCDAILFSTNHQLTAPNTLADMQVFRRRLLGHPDSPPQAGEYDLVVVGGGMAGICTAVSAARGGCSVALIQDRPVLGGNNSSEVRVGLSGLVRQEPYPKLGNLVDQIGPIGRWNKWEADRDPNLPRSKHILEVMKKHPEKGIHNAGPASNYEDQKKIDVVLAEKNISLFLNMHVNDVKMDGNRIASVLAQNTRTGERLKFKGRLFADCTGDGTIGYLAGADYRMGRESKEQTGESMAPEKPDKMTMGASVMWYSAQTEQPTRFPDCPWALQFTEESCQHATRGDWNWEAGMNRNQITEFEQIRDYGLRAVYGNWSFQKNLSSQKHKYANLKLAWVAYIGGKRESRRLLGDVILQEQDIKSYREFPDASVTASWSIDLHYPNPENTKYFPDAEFRAICKQDKIKPYPVPYRCFYSRNIENLFMAGRNISVTHVALGTVRVQRTTGMMGEVVGMAASLCKKYRTSPRGVYENHLDELKRLMQRGAGRGR